ncbi:haloacid dehalogenase [Actinoplanes utahensis]|uniref:D,D-heptose 1,7-bisphosphate phosphatase n=1 Tax=Actinoplanes utahensis TaxID=1869 RepID=A0A0A6UCC4_ACTUT|nr:haloacid dehalogenase [Actinoplanes utahensis]
MLFDRDGTLVVDVPYNGDPDQVRLMPGARAALDRLRAAGLRIGVVTNQSGLARGRFTAERMEAVHRRIEELLGPFDTWQICPHDDTAGCRCRKPEPGMVYAAAKALGTIPERCVMVGDIGRDMEAALAAGATGILVPTAITLPAEVAAAPYRAGDLNAAADLILQRQELLTPAPRPGAVPAAGRGTAAAGESRSDAAERESAAAGESRSDAAERESAAAGESRSDAAERGTVAAARPGTAGAGAAGTAGAVRAGTVLAVRSDSAGDVLVTGPAIRALAAGAERVVLLCGPRGRTAAELLPGVDEIVERRLPWIDPEPGPVDEQDMHELVERLREVGADEAVIFTSFHQSALPLALLMRMAGIGRITAISEDYPGTLLDVRHRVPEEMPEPERARSVAAAAGFGLPPGDDGRLRVTVAPRPRGGYVVVHPGASCQARSCPPEDLRRIVTALAQAGHRVVVTGGPGERHLAGYVAGTDGVDAGPMPLADLAALIAAADCLIVANTGPAHLAAAVGTPVVSLFAPTVPFGKWGPYRVPVVRLGDAAAACRDTRATRCPVPGHPCLSGIDPDDVLSAVRRLGVPRADQIEVAA